MRLRAYLTAIALAALVPMALFAAWVNLRAVEQERETFRKSAEARALTFLTAVDSEIDGSLTTISALAAVPDVAEGNLAYFRRLGQRILESQPNWLRITLTSVDGTPLAGVSRRAGDSPRSPDRSALETMLRSKAPSVGSLVFDDGLQAWGFDVLAPIYQGDELRFVLCARVSADSMQRIIAAQRLLPDWGAVILDPSDRFVARNWDSAKYAGKPASESLRGALKSAPSGWFRGRTVEGAEVYSPYWRSRTTGWAVSMGYPVAALDAGAFRAAWILAGGFVAALAAAILLAAYVSRRISRPIDALVAASDAMGRGLPVDVKHGGRIVEVRKLTDALRTASQAISERRDLVEHEKQALREADREKDRFLATLSHELRNPLAALSAAAQVLQGSAAGDDAARRATIIVVRQTHHMARLVEDLLDLGRIISGKVALDRHPLDLAALVGEIVAMARGTGPKANIQVIAEPGAVWVNADRVRIEEIVSNLLGNALKFTATDRSITVAVRREGDAAVLEIADEGKGMPAELIGRVFEMFEQGPDEVSQGKGGMGIGLAIVRRLTELHGGSVSAASEGPGRGSRFCVRLPAIEPPSASRARAGASADTRD
jgi:signal transduction histidine kinase